MTIVVRALEHDAEINAFFALAAATFPGYHRAHCTPEPDGSLANGWRRFNEADPTFESSRLRGAFLDQTLVGGYIHDERWLCVREARLRTGYVGGVVTDPVHRGLGVASALMVDGIALARASGQALLVLRGIPDFYDRFGFADVMEVTEHTVQCERVRALSAGSVCVRPAALDDAPALLELYERHYCGFPGAYARTMEQQKHLVRHRSSPPLLAVDNAGRASGYLLLPCGADRSVAVEAAADTWPMALALLQYHAGSSANAAEVSWPLPFGSPTYHHLADNLPLVSRTTSRPNAGWMARTVDLRELLDGMRSVWRGASSGWAGALTLEVDGECGHLQLARGEVQRVDRPPNGARQLHLSAGVLAQLVFGYRPAAWAASRPHQVIPTETLPALQSLFPTTIAWYAGSNRC